MKLIVEILEWWRARSGCQPGFGVRDSGGVANEIFGSSSVPVLPQRHDLFG